MEIERKFLVLGEPWKTWDPGLPLEQGYLARREGTVVRVRLTPAEGYLTVKGPTTGLSRAEFEYRISREDAQGLLRLCEPGVIVKTRYRVSVGNSLYEVDVFHASNRGLVVAEIELESEDQPFERPPWLGREVSHDPRYRNSDLGKNPYCEWSG